MYLSIYLHTVGSGPENSIKYGYNVLYISRSVYAYLVICIVGFYIWKINLSRRTLILLSRQNQQREILIQKNGEDIGH